MAGMLPGLFAPPARQEDQDIERNLQGLAQMDPFQQARYATLAGSRMAGQGLGQVAGVATGTDVRTPGQKQSEAVAAAKAQVAKLGLNPDDPKAIDEFYKKVIQILQSQGLATEAFEAMKEYRAEKTAATKDAYSLAESKRKSERDQMQNARALERNQILQQRLGAQAPEVIKLLGVLDEMNAPDALAKDPYKEKAIMDRIDALTAPKGLKVVQAGDHYDILDASGKKIGSGDVEARPLNEKDQAKADDKKIAQESAYKEAVAGAQGQYDAAVELYNHPGLNGILGPLGSKIGRAGPGGEESTLTTAMNIGSRQASLNASTVWDRVVGGTFLAGLAKLKAASPTGSTGLGAVSDVEGQKVQAAAASLGRLQSVASMRQHLAGYMQSLVEGVQRLGAAAAKEGISPIIQITPKPLTAGRAQSPATPPAAAPSPAPTPAAPVAPAAPQPAPEAVPTAPAGTPVRFERDANGKIQKVGG